MGNSGVYDKVFSLLVLFNLLVIIFDTVVALNILKLPCFIDFGLETTFFHPLLLSLDFFLEQSLFSLGYISKVCVFLLGLRLHNHSTDWVDVRFESVFALLLFPQILNFAVFTFLINNCKLPHSILHSQVLVFWVSFNDVLTHCVNFWLESKKSQNFGN